MRGRRDDASVELECSRVCGEGGMMLVWGRRDVELEWSRVWDDASVELEWSRVCGEEGMMLVLNWNGVGCAGKEGC